MNEMGAVTNFFYNIIPGCIFLFALNYLYKIDIIQLLRFQDKNEATVIFVYIVVGLFLGFFFQCFTKVLRFFKWNERVFKKVIDNNTKEFGKAYTNILEEGYKKYDPQKVKNVFYLMDNDLRCEKAAFLPTHFSSRHAFWSNISWGLIIIFIIGILFSYLKSIDCRILLVLIFFLCFSIYMANEHLFNFYDSILKSYFMKKFKSK